jgi:hypothetical protein
MSVQVHLTLEDVNNAMVSVNNSGYRPDHIILGNSVVSGTFTKSNFFEDIELCPICHGSDVRETKDGKFCNQLCKKLITISGTIHMDWDKVPIILSSSTRWIGNISIAGDYQHCI